MNAGNFRINAPYYLTCEGNNESAYDNSWPQQQQQQQQQQIRPPQNRNNNRNPNMKQFGRGGGGGRNYMFQGKATNRNNTMNNSMNGLDSSNEMPAQRFKKFGRGRGGGAGGGGGGGVNGGGGMFARQTFNANFNNRNGGFDQATDYNDSWQPSMELTQLLANNLLELQSRNWSNDYANNNNNMGNNNSNMNMLFHRREPNRDRNFNGDMNNRKRRNFDNSAANEGGAKMARNRNPGDRFNKTNKPKTAGGELNLEKHPVMLLNEVYAKKTKQLPVYNLSKEEGPVHRKAFAYTVTLGDKSYTPTTDCKTKKEAKALAARLALEEMGILAKDTNATATKAESEQIKSE